MRIHTVQSILFRLLREVHQQHRDPSNRPLRKKKKHSFRLLRGLRITLRRADFFLAETYRIFGLPGRKSPFCTRPASTSRIAHPENLYNKK